MTMLVIQKDKELIANPVPRYAFVGAVNWTTEIADELRHGGYMLEDEFENVANTLERIVHIYQTMLNKHNFTVQRTKPVGAL